MFGNIVANFEDLNQQETERYQELYCGLCHVIKERYGQLPRAGLSFDLTFFVLILNSLYEPTEVVDSRICIMHPIEKRGYAKSIYSEYAADLTVLMTYHKCLDDWQDDKKIMSQGVAKLLRSSYKKACKRRPQQAALVEHLLGKINELEVQENTSLDDAANCFGELMGELLAYQDDHWSDQLKAFGIELGRFVYAMDAAIDREDDNKSGSYNPFVAANIDPETIQMMLTVLIGKASEAFEKLPLVQDIRLLRSVLYAGVWQQYMYKNREANG